MEGAYIIQTPVASTTVQDGPELRLVKIGPGTGYSMMPVADNLRARRSRARHMPLQPIAKIQIPPTTDAERQSLPLFTHHPVEHQDPNPLTQEEAEFLAEYEQELAGLRQLPRAILTSAVPFYQEYPPPAHYPMTHDGQHQFHGPTPHHQMEAGNHVLGHQLPDTSDHCGGGVAVENGSDEGEAGGVEV